MFILIPSIIIFLCLSYLQLNDNVSIIAQIVLYSIMATTVAISLFLYKRVKTDMNLQDINSITIEIDRLQKIINKSDDQKIILGLKNKIKLLEEQKENLIKNTQS